MPVLSIYCPVGSFHAFPNPFRGCWIDEWSMILTYSFLRFHTLTLLTLKISSYYILLPLWFSINPSIYVFITFRLISFHGSHTISNYMDGTGLYATGSVCEKEKETQILRRLLLLTVTALTAALTIFVSLRLYAQITGAPSLSVPKATVFLIKTANKLVIVFQRNGGTGLI